MAINVLVDVEAAGASPINGQMSEFGAVALNKDNTAIDSTFHGILIEASPDPANPAQPLITPGAKRYDKAHVMGEFANWLNGLGDRPVFVSDNNGYDAMWITCAFDEVGIDNPFGHSSRRISDFYAGLRGNWKKTQQWKSLRVTNHSHQPVEDSMGNAEAWLALMQMLKDGQFDR